jgi:hypothetical protein
LQTINFVMSLRIPYDTTRESLNGFLWNLVVESCTELYPYVPVLVKIWQQQYLNAFLRESRALLAKYFSAR